MFEDEDNERLFAVVTEEELLFVMKSFKKDKCPGPDGWTIDIFIHFFDLMERDILGMVEETRIQGRIHQNISSTYIALIPKRKDSFSFADYRPISLCNVIYKIISKIIAERIRGNFSVHITKEQHGFLSGRNILEVMAIAQEALHSMQTKNIGVAILKIDLKKSYDCLDWSYLRCLLIKIGLNDLCKNWIMACVEGVNYAILINGYPTSFFRSKEVSVRGVHCLQFYSSWSWIPLVYTSKMWLQRGISTLFPYPEVTFLHTTSLWMTFFCLLCFVEIHGIKCMR